MSCEPIAKRTRLCALKSKLRCMSSARELQKKIDENNEKIMTAYNKALQSASSMREIEKSIREKAMACKCPQKCDCRRKLIKMVRKMKPMSDRLKRMRMKLFHSQQILASLTVEKLHPMTCKESYDCISRMQRLLTQDPLSLERKREPDPFPNVFGDLHCEFRRSSLHDAIRKAHVKCVKFLLEQGASVASLTTFESDTVLHTLYNTYMQSKDRLEILKLLLQYGVSQVFHHNQAGEFALKEASSDFCVEEVSLLLQHGATMCHQELQTTLATAWKLYDLPVIKQFTLYHSKRFILGPGAFPICLLLVQHCYKQMVSCGVPLHVCHRKLLEALQFYRVVGGRCSGYTKNGSKINLVHYLKNYRHNRHFRGVRNRIKALVSNPLSLKEISRLAVRKCIRRNYVENITQLELPVNLVHFLRFDDVIMTRHPRGTRVARQF